MAIPFQFEYDNKRQEGSAETFFENGLQKYRVAFRSRLIVLKIEASSLTSPHGLAYEQEVPPEEKALPKDLIQEIGWALENVEFFPGSFVVDFQENEVAYWAHVIKTEVGYKILDCFLPGNGGIVLPVLLTKKLTDNNITTWALDQPFSDTSWLTKLVNAIEKTGK
ncbi:MAG: hypothetical protein P4L51_23635 [Puia sp.]|nr:hypothetical protein [Puia sp.]